MGRSKERGGLDSGLAELIMRVGFTMLAGRQDVPGWVNPFEDRTILFDVCGPLDLEAEKFMDVDVTAALGSLLGRVFGTVSHKGHGTGVFQGQGILECDPEAEGTNRRATRGEGLRGQII